MRIAVLDLGTNTFHLLIVDLRKRGYKEICKRKEDALITLRYQEQSIISESTKERLLRIMAEYGALIREKKAEKIIAVATSAFRTTQNGREVVEEIRKKTGIRARIISGEEEAHLIYCGVSSVVGRLRTRYLVVDIGGGSIELVAVGDDKVIKKSLEIGAQRLLHAFHRMDPITEQEKKKLSSHLNEQFRSFVRLLPSAEMDCMVGTSGTFNTLGNLCKNPQMTPGPLLQILPAAVLQSTIRRVVSCARAERLAWSEIPVGRVDMIVVGALVVQHLMQRFATREIIISPSSMREGILQQELAKQP